jgi:hypothetical protein
MGKHIAWQEDGYERAWFTFVQNHEDFDECLAYIRRFLEEAILVHSKVLIEVHIPDRIPKPNVQMPISNIAEMAGVTS